MNLLNFKTLLSRKQKKEEPKMVIPEKPLEKYENWSWKEKNKPNSIIEDITKILQYALEHLEDKNVVSNIIYYEHNLGCADILDQHYKEMPSFPHTICLEVLSKQSEKEKKFIEKLASKRKNLIFSYSEESIYDRKQYADRIYSFYISKNRTREGLKPVLTYLLTTDYGKDRVVRYTKEATSWINIPVHNKRWLNIELPHEFFDKPLALLRERERIEEEREKSYTPDKIRETLKDIIPNE